MIWSYHLFNETYFIQTISFGKWPTNSHDELHKCMQTIDNNLPSHYQSISLPISHPFHIPRPLYLDLFASLSPSLPLFVLLLYFHPSIFHLLSLPLSLSYYCLIQRFYLNHVWIYLSGCIANLKLLLLHWYYCCTINIIF